MSEDEMLSSSSGFFSRPEEELLREIADTELEISLLEQHLLSLYRAVFRSYVTPAGGQIRHQRHHSASLEHAHGLQNHEDHPKDLECRRQLLAASKPISRHLRAAYRVSDSPGKLSEDMIRCISSVHAELADASSSTSSPVFLCDGADSQSVDSFGLTPRQAHSRKTLQGPYGCMLEVPKISADGARFASAAAKLKNYSALVRHLELTDPRGLTDDEKLAFWVNVHNALVMHAFLAYGLGHSSSFSRAAYDVGGLTVNAQDIRSSILRSQAHGRTQPRLRTLFPSRSQKSNRISARHPYSVDQPQPLVHFALCGGAYSDPAVRRYTAGNIRRELEVARDEFLQSNVWFEREKTRVVLPKLLVHYAAEAGLNQKVVLEMVRAAMAENWQKAALGSCAIDYTPYKSNFRYIIHRDLVQRV
ncbi:serine/Threonine-kinase, putative (Protein of unknown function, DUF547) isoform X2 [Wolffia australiana]